MSIKPIDFYDCAQTGQREDRPLQQRERKAIGIIGRELHTAATASILDVGCGNGFFLSELHRALGRDHAYHGVDYSAYKIKKAGALPYEFRQCNLEEGIPHADATFDVVYSGEVIEHLYNPDLMLEECHRILKPGGLLILTTPNFQAWYNRALFLLGIQPIFYEASTRSSSIGLGPLRRFKLQDELLGHVRLFNRRALIDILENEGFESVSVSGAIFPAFPRPIQLVDRMFNVRPSLASNFVATARPRALPAEG